MRILAFLAVALVGCGDPFTDANLFAPIEDAAPMMSDSSPDREHPGDTGADSKTGLDASPSVDSSRPDALDAAATPDVFDPPDVCTSPTDRTWDCRRQNGDTSTVHATSQYCMDEVSSFGWQVTPQECTGCVETYTCACIIAALGGSCGPGRTIVSCDSSQGGPFVKCQ